MHTRRSKLTEDAAESDGTPKSNTDVTKAMDVDVIAENPPQNYSSLETPEALVPEGTSLKNDSSSSRHLNLDYDSIKATDFSKIDNQISASKVPNQGEKATKRSVVGSCEDTTVDASIPERVPRAVVKVGDDVSDSVRTEGGASPNTSTEEVASYSITTEEGVSSNKLQTVKGASGSVKMEAAFSSVVEDAPSLTTSLTLEEGDASKMEHTLDESVAKPVVCSSEKPVAAEEIASNALAVETDSSSTTVPNATERPKNAIQIEESPSVTRTTVGDRSNMEGTPEKSIDSGSTYKSSTMDESCVLAKSEVVPESLEEKMHEKITEKKKAVRKYLNEMKAKFIVTGKKFCEERNIPFPSQRTLKNIIYDLHKKQKLNEKNLEIKLEKAAQRKLKASADAMETENSATLEVKIVGSDVSDKKVEGELSISFKSDVNPESPDKSISEKELVRREVKGKCEEYRDIGIKYCGSKKLIIPGWKRFRQIMFELASKQQLDVEEKKVPLDEHGWLAQEVASWDGARRTEPRLDANGEIIPSVVNKIAMTTEECQAAFEAFYTLQASMKPIAIKHCHTIKAPFPNKKQYYIICRDLFEVGMLDEENIKLAIEMDFEERCNLPLTYAQIDVILRRYCADNGNFDMSLKIMKAEILPKMPKELLCQKQFWNVMYDDQKTNLFLSEQLHPKAEKKGTPEDSNSSVAAKNERPEEKALRAGARKPKTRSDAKGEILPSVVKAITGMTSEAFIKELKSLEATMKPIAIKHCHTIKAPFPPIKLFNKVCRDLFEVGMLDEENIKLAIEMDFEEKCNLPLKDNELNFILRRYCADNGIFNMSLNRMQDEILPKIPNKFLCRKRYWNLMYEERKTNLFFSEEIYPKAANKFTPEDDKPSNVASRVQTNDAKAAGVASEPKSKQTNQEPVTPHEGIRQHMRNMAWDGNKQSESLRAMGLPWSNKKLIKMTENSPDRCDRGPLNASCSGATRNATSSSYTNTFSQRLDEEPIQQLVVQTQQWIAKKARAMSGPTSQKKVASQPLLSHKESHWGRSKMCWEENQEQRGKGTNFQAQRDLSQSQPSGLRAMNVPHLFPSAPIFPPAPYYFPEPNFSGQNLMVANFTSRTNISGAFGGQSSSSVQPAWLNEPRMENRGVNSAGIPRDDYYRNPGFGENSRHLETGLGGCSRSCDYEDPREGTSERGRSKRDRFSPPRNNKTKWGWVVGGRGNNELMRSTELLVANRPPPSIISTLIAKPALRNSQEQSRCNTNDAAWRFVGGAPPQKKSRFDEDRQPLPCQSVDLEHVTNEFKSPFYEDNRMFSEPFNPSTSSRRSRDQASPSRIGDQSKLLIVKENPPFVERGKTCKVAIVHEDYPKRRVTDREASLIRNALLERIGVQSGIGLRFSNTYDERGAVVFECEDQLTVSWLWVNASTIIPWTSTKLRPTSWEKPLIEISIHVPKLMESLTPKALCERLQGQNPKLSTENWKLKFDSTSSKGLKFVFYIDDESLKTLKSLDLRPYLGFSRVTVDVNQE